MNEWVYNMKYIAILHLKQLHLISSNLNPIHSMQSADRREAGEKGTDLDNYMAGFLY